jgi:hypothetical protein
MCLACFGRSCVTGMPVTFVDNIQFGRVECGGKRGTKPI